MCGSDYQAPAKTLPKKTSYFDILLKDDRKYLVETSVTVPGYIGAVENVWTLRDNGRGGTRINRKAGSSVWQYIVYTTVGQRFNSAADALRSVVAA